VNFVVPTGNFGDIFAGEAAARMGLAVDKLVIATNSNDILARTLSTGVYESGSAQPTLSPSMDIQVASNFERALFEASGRDAPLITELMHRFDTTRHVELPPDALKALRQRYLAERTHDSETIATIARVHQETGLVIDPHTAVGLAAAEALKFELRGPVVALATAHPAKFSDAVARAIGRPSPLPAHLSDLLSREERFTVVAKSPTAVADFVLERTKQK
jgi:threonine synthase